MYEEQGRIRVAFPEITAKKAETNDGVVVTIAINEGPVYTLGHGRAGRLAAGGSRATGEIGRLA